MNFRKKSTKPGLVDFYSAVVWIQSCAALIDVEGVIFQRLVGGNLDGKRGSLDSNGISPFGAGEKW
jgi:hypothetical protein